MDNLPRSQNTTDFSKLKIILSLFWIVSVILSGYIGFLYGQGNQSGQTNTEKNVLSSTSQVTDTPNPSPQSSSAAVSGTTPTVINNNACSRSGQAQKWEFLTSYVVQQDDTLQTIASEQLNDPSRVNEILQINGAGPLVVGSTLYLPPATIAKSSGNIEQVYGKLVEKNNLSWHISFTSDINGQGILIPSFWFAGIANKDTFTVGDCLKVLFDDGYKVYSVSLQ